MTGASQYNTSSVTASAVGPNRVTAAFRQNQPMLVRWLTRRLNDANEAQDIAQNAFIRVWHYAHLFEVSNAKGLLFKTAGRLALNELRRRNRHAARFSSLEEVEENPGLERSPIGLAGGQILHDDIIGLSLAISALPDKPRAAFMMHRLDGLDYGEIAERMKVSRSSVEKYMICALSHLRNSADFY